MTARGGGGDHISPVRCHFGTHTARAIRFFRFYSTGTFNRGTESSRRAPALRRPSGGDAIESGDRYSRRHVDDPQRSQDFALRPKAKARLPRDGVRGIDDASGWHSEVQDASSARHGQGVRPHLGRGAASSSQPKVPLTHGSLSREISVAVLSAAGGLSSTRS